jgi:hypothetical protein
MNTTIEGPRPNDVFSRSRDIIAAEIEELTDIHNDRNPFDAALERHAAREAALFEAGRNGVTFDAADVMVMLDRHRQDLKAAQLCYVTLQRVVKMLTGSLEQTATYVEHMQESQKAIHELEHMVARAQRMFDAAMSAVNEPLVDDDAADDDDGEDWMN